MLIHSLLKYYTRNAQAAWLRYLSGAAFASFPR